MDLDLRVTLNGILDPAVYAARQALLGEEDRLRYFGLDTKEDAMYGTSVPLGKAAITRAIQVRNMLLTSELMILAVKEGREK